MDISASPDGQMLFDHTFSGEKIKKRLTSTHDDDETRLYLGGVEYVDGALEACYPLPSLL